MNRRRVAWIAAGAGLTVALGAMTFWLLSHGARGAEIANVLALPVAVLGAVIGVIGIVVGVASRTTHPRTGVGQANPAPPNATGRAENERLGPLSRAEPTGRGHRAMTKELFFTCGAPAPLHDAAAELRRTGFSVRQQPRDVDGTWWLEAYSAASELSEDDLTVLDDIAVRCGVIFDGWGTYLGSPDHDNGPGKPAPLRNPQPASMPAPVPQATSTGLAHPEGPQPSAQVHIAPGQSLPEPGTVEVAPKPLSVRNGTCQPGQRQSEVSPDLEAALRRWLASFLTDYLHRRVALRMGRTIDPPHRSQLGEALDAVHGRAPTTGHLLEQHMTGPELLDAVDWALQLDPGAADEWRLFQMFHDDDRTLSRWTRANELVALNEILADASSIYTVGTEHGRCLLVPSH